VYHEWRTLYEALSNNLLLQMSPNYDMIIGVLVALGEEAHESYDLMCMDVFTGIPIGIEPPE
jgi:hypothetical protein